MTRAFAISLFAAAAYAASDAELRFINYVARFAKNIRDSDEFQERFENFQRNDAFIRIFNATEQMFEVGYSKFTDMDDFEFEEMLGAVETIGNPAHIKTTFASFSVPKKVDWRDHDIITPVKDQGKCAAGWAFAAVDALAADFAWEHGELLDFSAQELIDCASGIKFANNACKGGSVINSVENWYMKRHYVTQEKDYPYTSGETGRKGKCDYDGFKTTGIFAKDYARLIPDSVSMMKSWLAEGPLTVSMDASHIGFKNYARGIFTARDCGTVANHFALAVGYGHDDATKTDYWIIKNSWGSDWGEDGFARIEIQDGEGVCGIQKEAIAIRSKCENNDFCGDLTAKLQTE